MSEASNGIPALPCPNCAANLLANGFYNFCSERSPVTEAGSVSSHRRRGVLLTTGSNTRMEEAHRRDRANPGIASNCCFGCLPVPHRICP